MPGSSYWFQVHDQPPFGDLKKKKIKRVQKKSRFSGPPSLPSDKSKPFIRGVFTLVVSNALTLNIVLKSFEQVSLWPWNPALIRQLCQLHCPLPYPLKSTIKEEKLDQTMSDIHAEREAERCDIKALGELMTEDSCPEDPRYIFRERVRPGSTSSEEE